MEMPEQALTPQLSFILPARNEERFVGMAIESIRRFCPPELLCDIVLVDHGSTDRTREIASAAGAIVLRPSVETVAALRNAGAKVAKGNIFIFLDADVTLTEAWEAGIRETLALVAEPPLALSGSNCDAPDTDNWFLRYWFREMARDEKPGSLGSAHMIVPRELFEKLNGFDESLRTGEDPDLCDRTKALGSAVIPRPSLRVIHHGYPVTVRAFVRRERWHGGGDLVSLQRAAASKVVWMTVIFIALHVAIIAGLFVSPALALVALALLLAHLRLSVRIRFKRMRGMAAVRAMAIFYLYYFGRGLSFIHNRERGAR
jgi:glycosyltransferase involved in cell wall biosynthesis